jgi:hypothetical protein
MFTSLLSHHATDGSDLHAIVSVSAIRSLTPLQIQALATINIRRVSDLLHYRPIHDARLIAAIARREIAHDTIPSELVDDAYAGESAANLLSKEVVALRTVKTAAAEVFKTAFDITTIQQLADFKAFEEAQQFLTPPGDLFREAASTPSELMPQIVGAVQSTATYSSFVKKQTLRLKGVELTYDNTRIFFVDPLLAGLFPVRGFELLRPSHSSLLFPWASRNPEPVIKLGYACKHTQQWVNFGTFLGETVFSLALAPGESRNIAIVDWTRSQRTRRSEDTTVSEQLTNELFHTRALDEVTRSTAFEHQQGGTTIEAGTLSTAAAGVLGAGLAGGLAGTIPGAAIGAAAGAIAGTIEPGLGNVVGAVAGAGAGAMIGFGVGAAIAGGTSLVGAANAQIGTLRSDSGGDREIEGSLRQTITETVNQKASAVRSLRSNIFVTDEQAEREKLQTRNITNYNHSHMLNLEYFEVLQRYRVELRLTEAEPLLFLPFRPLDFTFELIRNYWPTLRRAVVPRSLRQNFDRLIDGIESGSVSTEAQTLKTVTVQLRLGIILPNTTLQVALTGASDVQQTKQMLLGGMTGSFRDVAVTKFFFSDSRPKVERLTGVSVTGLVDSVGITVLIETEDESGRVFRYDLEDSPVRPTDGIVNLPVNVGPSSDADLNAIDAIDGMERYFKERRYLFTRLLLLAIEKEQLIDLVEALQFQTTIEISRPTFPPPDFPDFPDRGLEFPGRLTLPGPPSKSATSSRGSRQMSLGRFASGKTRIASVATEDLSLRVRDRLRDRLIAKIPAKSRVADAAAVSSVVEHALDLVRGELNLSPPVDARSIRESTKKSVETVKRALVTVAGLTERQAKDVLTTAKLEDELTASLTETIKIPGILEVNVHLSEFIEPEPLAITGNTLVFRMKKVTDAEVLKNTLATGQLKPLVDQPSLIQDFVSAIRGQFTSHDVHLPTTGVFAEAILGRANASEKIDLTRFFNWQDSPIPNLAPRIADLQAGGRAGPPLETDPTVPAGVVNIVNPPAFPDPTGLAASLAAVQNGNLFRDMSKTEALAGVLANLSNLANQQGQLAGTLAGNAQKEALQSAVSFGNKIADLTGQALQAQQQPSAPQTPTEKGGALNELDKLIAAQGRSLAAPENSPPASDIARDPRARVVGVSPRVENVKIENSGSTPSDGLGSLLIQTAIDKGQGAALSLAGALGTWTSDPDAKLSASMQASLLKFAEDEIKKEAANLLTLIPLGRAMKAATQLAVAFAEGVGTALSDTNDSLKREYDAVAGSINLNDDGLNQEEIERMRFLSGYQLTAATKLRPIVETGLRRMAGQAVVLGVEAVRGVISDNFNQLTVSLAENDEFLSVISSSIEESRKTMPASRRSVAEGILAFMFKAFVKQLAKTEFKESLSNLIKPVKGNQPIVIELLAGTIQAILDLETDAVKNRLGQAFPEMREAILATAKKLHIEFKDDGTLQLISVASATVKIDGKKLTAPETVIAQLEAAVAFEKPVTFEELSATDAFFSVKQIQDDRLRVRAAESMKRIARGMNRGQIDDANRDTTINAMQLVENSWRSLRQVISTLRPELGADQSLLDGFMRDKLAVENTVTFYRLDKMGIGSTDLDFLAQTIRTDLFLRNEGISF